jgi:hypothetical protein
MKTKLVALSVLALAMLAGCKSEADKAAEAAARQAIQARAIEASKALCSGDVATFTSAYMTEEAGNDFGLAVAEAFDEGYKSAHPILGRAAGAMSQQRILQLVKSRVAKTGAAICTLETVQLEALSGQHAKVALGIKFKTSHQSLTTKWDSTSGTWLIKDAGDVQTRAAERVRIAAAKS